MHLPEAQGHSGRRAFLRNGSLILLAAGVDHARATALFADDQQACTSLRIGLVTDLHYADKNAAGSRHYRESIGKLAVAARQFAAAQPDLVVNLGDFIDAAKDVATEKKWLAKIQAEFARLPGEKHFVLGNHCVTTLTKPEFLDGVKQKKSYYSFDAGGNHFVVLDACFRKDGVAYGRNNFNWTDTNLPDAEMHWLASDLAATKKKTIVFVHQRLDVGGAYGLKNAPQVRTILEDSNNVLAVFQGHNHVNDHKLIGGIHYCTLMAMVEGSGEQNNAYATMDVLGAEALCVQGFRKQQDYRWT